jgi:hypothetical protein
MIVNMLKVDETPTLFIHHYIANSAAAQIKFFAEKAINITFFGIYAAYTGTKKIRKNVDTNSIWNSQQYT